MDTQKQSIIDRLKQGNNVLVTVSKNPSVDQLAACIGLTLALNKFEKHATAVFSGETPSTILFLKPENTLEKNTDSLRDFIISLDKSKADKLRYKVEENVVKIFITPYRTSINQSDLVFSQGDFNVDIVLAIGVHEQQDLDQAIVSHGRILHDATVASINNVQGPELGTLNWVNHRASSLSEMIISLIDGIDDKLVDNQIATALLTGIVAETDRFSNEKTSPTTMTLSAQLMAAGADQQLVASKLQEPDEISIPEVVYDNAKSDDETQSSNSIKPDQTMVSSDGTLEISHLSDARTLTDNSSLNESDDQINVDSEGNLLLTDETADQDSSTLNTPSVLSLPPIVNDNFVGNKNNDLNTDSEDTTLPYESIASEPTLPELERQTTIRGEKRIEPIVDKKNQPFHYEEQHSTASWQGAQTLSDLEKAVQSSHVVTSELQHVESIIMPIEEPNNSIDQARNAVDAAINGNRSQIPPPIESLNAQPLPDLRSSVPLFKPNSEQLAQFPIINPQPNLPAPSTMPLPPANAFQQAEQVQQPVNPNDPPPLPPPMMPQNFFGQQ